MQMTRKRSGKTLVQQLTNICDKCKGLGFIKATRTQCYCILRKFKEGMDTFLLIEKEERKWDTLYMEGVK